MKRSIEKLLSEAIEAISSSKMANDRNEVNSAYKGQISAMGGSIVQSGLLPTIAFCMKADNKDANSLNLLQAILILLEGKKEPQAKTLIEYVLTKCRVPDTQTELIKLRDLDRYEINRMKQRIGDCLIALKLALRTYKLLEKQEVGNE